MRKNQFEDAVVAIQQKDPRFKPDAYFFLRDSLEHTVKTMRKDELIEHSHVTGRELLDGMKEFAIEEFGSMSLPVLESWGIHSGRDVGAMVYNLIKEEAFGKSEEDHPNDFEGWLEFDAAFVEPYRPTRQVLARPGKSVGPVHPPSRDTEPATSSEA